MRLHYIQHVPFEDPANILVWANLKGVEVTSTKIYSGDSFPVMDTFDWLMVMGGPMSTYEEEQYHWLVEEKSFIRSCIDAGKTVIGICLGAQLLADVLGGKVFPNNEKEIGWFPIEWTLDAKISPYFRGMPERPDVFHWHGDTFTVPDWTVIIGSSDTTANQGFIAEEGGALVIGLQFHLESTPESVKSIIDNTGKEIMPAAHVQVAESMLSRKESFASISEMLFRMLDNIYSERSK